MLVEEGCGGWTTLASSDSVGHAYLFDILRSEMRFFFPETELRISHSLSSRFPVFLFFLLSPLSLLPLVYEVGNELWPLEKISPLVSTRISLSRSKREVFVGCDRPKLGLGPTAIVLPSSIVRRSPKRLIGRSFFPSSFFLKLSSSFSSPLANTVARSLLIFWSTIVLNLRERSIGPFQSSGIYIESIERGTRSYSRMNYSFESKPFIYPVLEERAALERSNALPIS